MEGPLILRAILAFLLYAFLTVALYVMWKGLRHQDRDQSAAPPPAWLVIDTDQPPRRIALYPITALGRADDNHIVLDDPFASSHHAMVAWRDRRWWLEDLQSHNGTLLNGEQITEPTVLNAGDRIRIGESFMHFEAEGAQSPADRNGPPAPFTHN